MSKDNKSILMLAPHIFGMKEAKESVIYIIITQYQTKCRQMHFSHKKPTVVKTKVTNT